jgi:septum formation protein
VRLARAKAEASRARRPDAYVLAADTIVAVGRRVLGKAADEAEARRFLSLISGRAHRVLSAVCLIAPDGRMAARLSESRLIFKRLTAQEIAAYVATDEWRDKAGAYAVQGRAGGFVMSLSGSYSGVVGLPLYETACLLEGLGYRP